MGKNVRIQNCTINARKIVQYSLNTKFRAWSWGLELKMWQERPVCVLPCVPGSNPETGVKVSRDWGRRLAGGNKAIQLFIIKIILFFKNPISSTYCVLIQKLWILKHQWQCKESDELATGVPKIYADQDSPFLLLKTHSEAEAPGTPHIQVLAGDNTEALMFQQESNWLNTFHQLSLNIHKKDKMDILELENPMTGIKFTRCA